MRIGLATAVLLAAGLAGCGATPVETFNDKEKPLPPGQGAFGSGLTWEWTRKSDAATPAPAAAPLTTAEQEEFKKWQESAGSKDRQEFEDWRAWQEWRKKNPK